MESVDRGEKPNFKFIFPYSPIILLTTVRLCGNTNADAIPFPVSISLFFLFESGSGRSIDTVSRGAEKRHEY
jgi:hypothetical protein